MNIPLIESRTEFLRWALCGATVVFLHGAVAAAIIHWNDDDTASEPTAALVVDLSSMPTAPPETVEDVPPGPLQSEAEASPQVVAKEQKEEVEERPETDSTSREEVVPELAREVNPEVALDTTPPKPEQTAEVPQEAQLPSEASAPPPMPEVAPAEVAAAPVQGPPIVDRPKEDVQWSNAVFAQLQRNLRWPAGARNARGVARVSFVLDRRGRVTSSRLVTTSGSPTLDREALEVLQRAQPFPLPPSTVTDADMIFAVPLEFNVPKSARR